MSAREPAAIDSIEQNSAVFGLKRKNLLQAFTGHSDRLLIFTGHERFSPSLSRPATIDPDRGTGLSYDSTEPGTSKGQAPSLSASRQKGRNPGSLPILHRIETQHSRASEEISEVSERLSDDYPISLILTAHPSATIWKIQGTMLENIRAGTLRRDLDTTETDRFLMNRVGDCQTKTARPCQLSALRVCSIC